MSSLENATSVTDTDTETKPPLVIGARDIVFLCPACAGELVVDRDGAGLTVPCPHCAKSLTIPSYTPPPGSSHAAEGTRPSAPAGRQFDLGGKSSEEIERRTAELQHQLKENRSQDTEMRGHLNRANMELHRLQLRLQKLQERRADIEAELAAINDLSGEGS